jgi:hypothetical protein
MLDAPRFGIAGGIVWGISMFILTLLAVITGYSQDFLTVLSSLYPGYTISWLGSILGLVYGFIDAFFFLFFLAWIYNKLKI